MGKLKSIIRQVIPWVITAGILAYIFGTQDYMLIWETFRKANLALFIPVAVFILVTCYLLDCASQTLALKWFCAPVRFRDVMVARGVSFLLMLINFNLGQGGMVYFFYRLTGKSLRSVASAFFFTVFADAYAFITMFTVSIYFLRDQPEFLMVVAPMCAGAWIHWVIAYGYWRWGWKERVFKRFSDWEILSSFREAKFWQYAVIYALRAPILYMILGLFYLAMVSFGGEVPAVKFIVLMPVVLMISGLPIAVAGLGTTQMGWNLIFGAHTSAELGTALTLAGNFSMIIVNTIIALICLPFGGSFLSAVKQSREEPEPEPQPEIPAPSSETLQD